MLFPLVLDAKIVNYEGKCEGPPNVASQAHGELEFVEAVGSQTFGKEVACEHASLREAVHSTTNLNIDPTIFDEAFKLVRVADLL